MYHLKSIGDIAAEYKLRIANETVWEIKIMRAPVSRPLALSILCSCGVALWNSGQPSYGDLH